MDRRKAYVTEHGLGRIHQPDSRDHNYRMAALTAATTRPYQYWSDSRVWLDQGATSQCVAYSWTHWWNDGPVTHTPGGLAPGVLYHEAQTLDDWPGESYEGTSVRAGAKALQARGLVSSYWWGFTLDEIVAALLERGPVVVGTIWYESMFTPGSDHRLTVDPASGLAGGHAYVLNGVNRRTGLVRLKNSWGREWGHHGRAWITFDDLRHLIEADGEACIAIEVP